MEYLEKVGLSERASSKVKTYSQGMKQRLGIAIALVHDPQLIILDEPMNGLDPQGIADIRNLILHLSREKEKTILVSSHLLSEMEVIAAIVFLFQIALWFDGKTYIELILGNIDASFDFSDQFKTRLLNGYFVCFAVLNILLIQMPLLVALVAGDVIAGEANMGTLR